MGSYLKLKYVFIFYAIIRFPLHQLTGLQDSAGRIYSLLLLIVLVYYLGSKKLGYKILRSPLKYWGLWVIYVLINLIFQGTEYDMKPWQLVTFIVAPLGLMYFVNIRDRFYIVKNIRVVSIASFVSLLIILFNDTYTSYLDGDRLGAIMNANEIGVGGLLCLLFLFLLYNYKVIKLYIFIILSFIPTYVVLMSGSRSVFLPFVLIVSSIFVINRSKSFLKSIIILLFGLFVIIFVVFPIIEQNTVVVERLKESKNEGEVYTGTVLDNMGSRVQYYVFGFDMFKENLLFGVGLFNYRKYNPINTQPNHVEIMTQLSELGIIGFLLFLLFNFWIAKHLFYCWRNDVVYRKQTEAFIVGYLSIVSLYFVAYTYWNILIGLFLGITIAHIMETENRIMVAKNSKKLNYNL